VKIVLDTNVLVSALLKPRSKPAAVLRLVINGHVQIAFDIRILTEYREVLERPRFHFTSEQIDPLLDYIEDEGVLAVGVPLPKGLPDPADEPFLEVALSARADAIVTGNKRHYPATASAGIRILSPAEFLEFFHSSRITRTRKSNAPA
jgi:putative PIN family toxin of toxin-antitoxin system